MMKEIKKITLKSIVHKRNNAFRFVGYRS